MKQTSSEKSREFRLKNPGYHKKWRDSNKEKCLYYARKWREINPEKSANACRKYYKNNSEKCRIASKKWKDKNKEHLKEYGSKRDKEKNAIRCRNYREKNRGLLLKKEFEYRENNKSKRADSYRSWCVNNKGRANFLKRSREKRVLAATPKWADMMAIKQIYIKASRTGMHVDHIIPLVHPLVSGLHVENNLQIITQRENNRKYNKWPYTGGQQ